MSQETINGKPMHPRVADLARETREGKLDRREFLAMATALGVTGPAAYGLHRPHHADARPRQGRKASPAASIKISQAVMRMDDPRIFDWSQKGNQARLFCRAAGALHRRLHLRALADRKLGSQRGRDRIHAQRPPGRDLEQRRRLHRRRRDLQPQPLVREPRARTTRWRRACSPCSRRRARRRSWATSPRTTARVVQEEQTRELFGARDGAIEKVDDFTVKLHLADSRHHHRAELRRLPGADRAPRLRRGRGRPHRQPDRHRPVGARLAPRWACAPSTSAAPTAPGGATRSTTWGRSILDGIEFIDYGTDPSAEIAAFEAGEIHTSYETAAELRRDLRRARPHQVRGGDRQHALRADERQAAALRQPGGPQRRPARRRQRHRARPRLPGPRPRRREPPRRPDAPRIRRAARRSPATRRRPRR